ncbi:MULTISPECIES: YciI family protein [Erwinia]|uniref:YciI family protein n=1 Tax=Erwinia papayae TaxID=206499 RepID=A0ABV3MXX2_9GAMM|nr:YciI family protein [Erwinia mallotivora]
MYIVSLSYTRPIVEVEPLLEAHLSWLNHYLAAGVFIAAGRKEPRTGGVIIVSDMESDRLDAILAEDAFQAVADYEVTKVNVTVAGDEFASLVGR